MKPLVSKGSLSETAQSIQSLRAIRHYSGQNIDDQTVLEWINVVRWCGSSKNSQPWRFVIIRNRQTLLSLSKLGTYASHLSTCELAIAIAMETSGPTFSRNFDLGRITQSLMLLANDEGVGSCPAVFEPVENVQKAGTILGASETTTVDLAVAFGFPGNPQRMSDKDQLVSPPGRLPTDKLVNFERLGR